MKTSVKLNEIKRAWYIVDAEGSVLGRLASEVATILQGKNRAYYSPQWDMGDNVVIVNAEKVKLTGNKERNKTYFSHSGFPGGIKGVTAGQMRRDKPERMIELAVKRMLPKSRLANVMIKKMHVYVGSEHPHGPQEPVVLEIKG